MTIPDMGANLIGTFLQDAASNSQGAIIEVGSWLGAGTFHLAKGAKCSGQPLFVYDRWEASKQEVEKAARQGLQLDLGQDLLPFVEKALKPVGANVEFCKGDIRKAQYGGAPIGLYVDDAAKLEPLFRIALSTFAPYWLDGAVLVLMDYYYFEKAGRPYRFQHDLVQRFSDHFTPINLPNQSRSTHAAFEYHVLKGEFKEWVETQNSRWSISMPLSRLASKVGRSISMRRKNGQ